MTRLRVGVIFGGRSGEHEVSLRSAATVLAALDSDKYDVVPIGITKQGEWLFDGDPMRVLRQATEAPTAELESNQRIGVRSAGPLVPPVGAGALGGRALDVVIPILHGTYGEDGTVQGLLELAQIPYAGSGVLASAVGMDKAVMKDVFRQHGLPVVASLVVMRREWRADPALLQARIDAELGYPCFVKPANMGSSVGVTKVIGADDLPSALDAAAEYDRKVVVERAVAGCRELEIAVLGNDDPIASLPGEVVPLGEFYDYVAKYSAGASRVFIPAELPPDLLREAQRLAIEAYQAIGCDGFARVDCFLNAEGELFVNEVNTIPGLTPTSMYHQLWAASGVGIVELIDRLIALALERFAHRQSLRTSYQPALKERFAA